MQTSNMLSSAERSLPIAFMVGMISGISSLHSYSNSPSTSAPFNWDFAIGVILLVGGMLLSILLDPLMRQGTIALGRTVLSLVLVVFLVGGITAVFFVLPALNQEFSFIEWILIPFSIGLSTAFMVGVVDSGGKLAIPIALAAWFGVGIGSIISLVIAYSFILKPVPIYGVGFAVIIATLFFLIMAVVATLGGITGKFLRIWFLGRS